MTSDATVVLVHGLAILHDPAAMFTGVAEALRGRGLRVARTLVRGDGTLEEVADRHWEQIAPLEGRLLLLCHSMGGLVARTFLLEDRRAQRLAAIATLGTPHGGTPLATVMAPFGSAYRALTPVARARWNTAHGVEEEAAARRWGTRCLSACAVLSTPARHPYLLPTQAMLAGRGGSDGLVPVASQRWGEHAFDVDLDHNECAALPGASPRLRSSIGAWLRLASVALAAAGTEWTGAL